MSAERKPRIIVYTAIDDPPHEGARYIARIWCEFTTSKGKVKHDWHPVVVYDSTMEDAYTKALAWWDAEVEKAARKAQNIANGVAKRRAALQSSGAANG